MGAVANASCMLMSIRFSGVLSHNYNQFNMFVVQQDQFSMLASNVASGLQDQFDSLISNHTVAFCSGLSCNEISGRWLSVSLDPNAIYHVIVEQHIDTDSACGCAQEAVFLMQAHSSSGDLL